MNIDVFFCILSFQKLESQMSLTGVVVLWTVSWVIVPFGCDTVLSPLF